MLHGSWLYRDIWYDKPPLSPLIHLLVGAKAGTLLRVLGAAYCFLCSLLAFGFARDLWDERAGRWAAALTVFFLTFDFPASVLPLGPDLLTVAPSFGTVWLAWRGRHFWAGALAAIAFFGNTKGLFLFPAALVFCQSAPLWCFVGFGAPTALALAALTAVPGYWDQAWLWSLRYASSPFEAHPLTNGLIRSANWLGFHAALVAGSLWRLSWRFVFWMLLSAAPVFLGRRFFPRYYLQLLPPLIIAAAYGASRLRFRAWAVAALLVIPLVRFAPRYVTVARGAAWADTALDRDSRTASERLRAASHPGDNLFIWGYRPELWTYARLPDATRFLDSQPLTGVPADRHLTQSEPIDVVHPPQARLELAQSRPTFVADGLSLYNPRLAITEYPELREWFSHYREFARTAGTVLYRRADTIER